MDNRCVDCGDRTDLYCDECGGPLCEHCRIDIGVCMDCAIGVDETADVARAALRALEGEGE